MSIDHGQMYHHQSDKESLNNPEFDLWLTGFFEVLEGNVRFSIQQKKDGREYAYPIMQIVDSDKIKLTKIQSILGGTIQRQREVWSWMLYGERVVPYSEALFKNSLSRKEALTAIKNWESSTIAERVNIAQEFSQYYSPTIISKDEYSDLVRNSDFLAGVIDSKAVFSFAEQNYPNESYYVAPKMFLTSTNTGLVEALCEEYGGSIQYIEAGTEIEVRGIKSIRKTRSAKWQLNTNQIKNLISKTNGKLRIEELPSEWNLF